MNNLKEIPEIGKQYHFFDDGKISPSRHFIATVEEIIPIEETKNIVLKTIIGTFTEETEFTEMSLYDIWSIESMGHPWIYAPETDYIIKCSIPEYDNDPIYFIRTRDGGWFSMDITSGWQAGRLDIDEKLTESLKEYGYEF
jgi:hypothetical protein